MERRIKSLIRWNAMAMVVRANKYDDELAAISPPFLRWRLCRKSLQSFLPRVIWGPAWRLHLLPGHASPGVYARAFLEGRLSEKHLENFRHELREHPGLSSYPHPMLMPDFWNFPTVSMGSGRSIRFTRLGSCGIWKTAG